MKCHSDRSGVEEPEVALRLFISNRHLIQINSRTTIPHVIQCDERNKVSKYPQLLFCPN